MTEPLRLQNGDVTNPIYEITAEQGQELRRCFANSVDMTDSRTRSLANRMLYANEITHKALFYAVCQIVDAGREKLPDWVGKLFDQRKEIMKQHLETI